MALTAEDIAILKRMSDNAPRVPSLDFSEPIVPLEDIRAIEGEHDQMLVERLERQEMMIELLTKGLIAAATASGGGGAFLAAIGLGSLLPGDGDKPDDAPSDTPTPTEDTDTPVPEA